MTEAKAMPIAPLSANKRVSNSRNPAGKKIQDTPKEWAKESKK